jgi:transcriptional regulator of heat shock response
MLSSKFLRTIQHSNPFFSRRMVSTVTSKPPLTTSSAIGTIAFVAAGTIGYDMTRSESLFSPQIAYCDASSARSKLSQEELEELKKELAEELSNEKVTEAVRDAKKEIEEAMNEAKDVVDEAVKEAGGVNSLAGLIVTGMFGIVAGTFGLVASILSNVDIEEEIKKGNVTIEIGDTDNTVKYDSGIEYHESVTGAVTIKYPDGYVYKQSVTGAVTITGPNGYYYKKSVTGSVTSRGICNSRFEMGKHD